MNPAVDRMSRRSSRLAWGLALLAPALMLASGTLALAGGSDAGSVFIWAIALVFAAVGGLIAARHPDNPIGWIFLAAGVAAGLGSLSHSLTDQLLDDEGGALALGKLAALYAEISWMPFILMPATFLLLLFPDGRLLSPRWRPIAWCAGVGLAGSFIAAALNPGKIPDFPEVMNPIGVDSPILDLFEGLTLIALLIGIAGSGASLIVRFRRSRGEQRQQMKWLAVAGAVTAVVIPVAVMLYDVIGENVANGVIMASVLCLPVAAGVAITRYRLYDIDVVVNRTLVYGALTALLAGFYLGSVLLFQLALRPLTENSNLAIAASTLAVAALFRPARRRIQEAVDRRFYRRKYDAQRTLEAFSTRLRDQVDLAALHSELRAVVTETMHPTHMSVWLRGPTQ